MLSQRALSLKTSPTLFLVAKAKELAAQGHDVLSLTVGEPDWATFPQICQAGIEAIQKGITKYTPANGTIELRQLVCKQLKRDFGFEYQAKEVTVASGAKFVIFAALQMLCNQDDEVIISAPYWVSYPTMIELAGGKPVIIDCGPKENFKVTAAQLKKAITAKTKAFLFCSPSNPTGLVYSKSELEQIAEVLKQYPHVAIISDDMYNRLMFDGSKLAPHILEVAPELKDRTVIVNGGSKTYAMTGWRIGWAAGPEKLIKAMGDYQSQSTGSPSSISQYATQVALTDCEQNIQHVVETLKQRKDFAIEAFRQVPELKLYIPDGAFYLWVDLHEVIGRTFEGQKIQTSKDFCDILLNKFYVATVPGSECGSEGFMRLSFACSTETMQRAIARMKEFISSMNK